MQQGALLEVTPTAVTFDELSVGGVASYRALRVCSRGATSLRVRVTATSPLLRCQLHNENYFVLVHDGAAALARGYDRAFDDVGVVDTLCLHQDVAQTLVLSCVPDASVCADLPLTPTELTTVTGEVQLRVLCQDDPASNSEAVAASVSFSASLFVSQLQLSTSALTITVNAGATQLVEFAVSNASCRPLSFVVRAVTLPPSDVLDLGVYASDELEESCMGRDMLLDSHARMRLSLLLHARAQAQAWHSCDVLLHCANARDERNVLPLLVHVRVIDETRDELVTVTPLLLDFGDLYRGAAAAMPLEVQSRHARHAVLLRLAAAPGRVRCGDGDVWLAKAHEDAAGDASYTRARVRGVSTDADDDDATGGQHGRALVGHAATYATAVDDVLVQPHAATTAMLLVYKPALAVAATAATESAAMRMDFDVELLASAQRDVTTAASATSVTRAQTQQCIVLRCTATLHTSAIVVRPLLLSFGTCFIGQRSCVTLCIDNHTPLPGRVVVQVRSKIITIARHTTRTSNVADDSDTHASDEGSDGRRVIAGHATDSATTADTATTTLTAGSDDAGVATQDDDKTSKRARDELATVTAAAAAMTTTAAVTAREVCETFAVAASSTLQLTLCMTPQRVNPTYRKQLTVRNLCSGGGGGGAADDAQIVTIEANNRAPPEAKRHDVLYTWKVKYTDDTSDNDDDDKRSSASNVVDDGDDGSYSSRGNDDRRQRDDGRHRQRQRRLRTRRGDDGGTDNSKSDDDNNNNKDDDDGDDGDNDENDDDDDTATATAHQGGRGHGALCAITHVPLVQAYAVQSHASHDLHLALHSTSPEIELFCLRDGCDTAAFDALALELRSYCRYGDAKRVDRLLHAASNDDDDSNNTRDSHTATAASSNSRAAAAAATSALVDRVEAVRRAVLTLLADYAVFVRELTLPPHASLTVYALLLRSAFSTDALSKEDGLSIVVGGVDVARFVRLSYKLCGSAFVVQGQSTKHFGEVNIGVKKVTKLSLVNRCGSVLFVRISKSRSVTASHVRIERSDQASVTLALRPYASREVEVAFYPGIRGAFQERLRLVNVLDPVHSTATVTLKAVVTKADTFDVVPDTLSLGIAVKSATTTTTATTTTATTTATTMGDGAAGSTRVTAKLLVTNTSKAVRQVLVRLGTGSRSHRAATTSALAVPDSNSTSGAAECGAAVASHAASSADMSTYTPATTTTTAVAAKSENKEDDNNSSMTTAAAAAAATTTATTKQPRTLQDILGLRAVRLTLQLEMSVAGAASSSTRKIEEEIEHLEQKLKIYQRKKKLDKMDAALRRLAQLRRALQGGCNDDDDDADDDDNGADERVSHHQHQQSYNDKDDDSGRAARGVDDTHAIATSTVASGDGSEDTTTARRALAAAAAAERRSRVCYHDADALLQQMLRDGVALPPLRAGESASIVFTLTCTRLRPAAAAGGGDDGDILPATQTATLNLFLYEARDQEVNRIVPVDLTFVRDGDDDDSGATTSHDTSADHHRHNSASAHTSHGVDARAASATAAAATALASSSSSSLQPKPRICLRASSAELLPLVAAAAMTPMTTTTATRAAAVAGAPSSSTTTFLGCPLLALRNCLVNDRAEFALDVYATAPTTVVVLEPRRCGARTRDSVADALFRFYPRNGAARPDEPLHIVVDCLPASVGPQRYLVPVKNLRDAGDVAYLIVELNPTVDEALLLAEPRLLRFADVVTPLCGDAAVVAVVRSPAHATPTVFAPYAPRLQPRAADVQLLLLRSRLPCSYALLVRSTLPSQLRLYTDAQCAQLLRQPLTRSYVKEAMRVYAQFVPSTRAVRATARNVHAGIVVEAIAPTSSSSANGDGQAVTVVARTVVQVHVRIGAGLLHVLQTHLDAGVLPCTARAAHVTLTVVNTSDTFCVAAALLTSAAAATMTSMSASRSHSDRADVARRVELRLQPREQLQVPLTLLLAHAGRTRECVTLHNLTCRQPPQTITLTALRMDEAVVVRALAQPSTLQTTTTTTTVSSPTSTAAARSDDKVALDVVQLRLAVVAHDHDNGLQLCDTPSCGDGNGSSSSNRGGGRGDSDDVDDDGDGGGGNDACDRSHSGPPCDGADVAQSTTLLVSNRSACDVYLRVDADVDDCVDDASAQAADTACAPWLPLCLVADTTTSLAADVHVQHATHRRHDGREDDDGDNNAAVAVTDAAVPPSWLRVPARSVVRARMALTAAPAFSDADVQALVQQCQRVTWWRRVSVCVAHVSDAPLVAHASSSSNDHDHSGAVATTTAATTTTRATSATLQGRRTTAPSPSPPSSLSLQPPPPPPAPVVGQCVWLARVAASFAVSCGVAEPACVDLGVLAAAERGSGGEDGDHGGGGVVVEARRRGTMRRTTTTAAAAASATTASSSSSSMCFDIRLVNVSAHVPLYVRVECPPVVQLPRRRVCVAPLRTRVLRARVLPRHLPTQGRFSVDVCLVNEGNADNDMTVRVTGRYYWSVLQLSCVDDANNTNSSNSNTLTPVRDSLTLPALRVSDVRGGGSGVVATTTTTHAEATAQTAAATTTASSTSTPSSLVVPRAAHVLAERTLLLTATQESVEVRMRVSLSGKLRQLIDVQLLRGDASGGVDVVQLRYSKSANATASAAANGDDVDDDDDNNNRSESVAAAADKSSSRGSVQPPPHSGQAVRLRCVLRDGVDVAALATAFYGGGGGGNNTRRRRPPHDEEAWTFERLPELEQRMRQLQTDDVAQGKSRGGSSNNNKQQRLMCASHSMWLGTLLLHNALTCDREVDLHAQLLPFYMFTTTPSKMVLRPRRAPCHADAAVAAPAAAAARTRGGVSSSSDSSSAWSARMCCCAARAYYAGEVHISNASTTTPLELRVQALVRRDVATLVDIDVIDKSNNSNNGSNNNDYKGSGGRSRYARTRRPHVAGRLASATVTQRVHSAAAAGVDAGDGAARREGNSSGSSGYHVRLAAAETRTLRVRVYCVAATMTSSSSLSLRDLTPSAACVEAAVALLVSHERPPYDARVVRVSVAPAVVDDDDGDGDAGADDDDDDDDHGNGEAHDTRDSHRRDAHDAATQNAAAAAAVSADTTTTTTSVAAPYDDSTRDHADAQLSLPTATTTTTTVTRQHTTPSEDGDDNDNNNNSHHLRITAEAEAAEGAVAHDAGDDDDDTASHDEVLTVQRCQAVAGMRRAYCCALSFARDDPPASELLLCNQLRDRAVAYRVTVTSQSPLPWLLLPCNAGTLAPRGTQPLPLRLLSSEVGYFVAYLAIHNTVRPCAVVHVRLSANIYARGSGEAMFDVLACNHGGQRVRSNTTRTCALGHVYGAHTQRACVALELVNRAAVPLEFPVSVRQPFRLTALDEAAAPTLRTAATAAAMMMTASAGGDGSDDGGACTVFAPYMPSSSSSSSSRARRRRRDVAATATTSSEATRGTTTTQSRDSDKDDGDGDDNNNDGDNAPMFEGSLAVCHIHGVATQSAQKYIVVDAHSRVRLAFVLSCSALRVPAGACGVRGEADVVLTCKQARDAVFTFTATFAAYRPAMIVAQRVCELTPCLTSTRAAAPPPPHDDNAAAAAAATATRSLSDVCVCEARVTVRNALDTAQVFAFRTQSPVLLVLCGSGDAARDDAAFARVHTTASAAQPVNGVSAALLRVPARACAYVVVRADLLRAAALLNLDKGNVARVRLREHGVFVNVANPRERVRVDVVYDGTVATLPRRLGDGNSNNDDDASDARTRTSTAVAAAVTEVRPVKIAGQYLCEQYVLAFVQRFTNTLTHYADRLRAAFRYYEEQTQQQQQQPTPPPPARDLVGVVASPCASDDSFASDEGSGDDDDDDADVAAATARDGAAKAQEAVAHAPSDDHATLTRDAADAAVAATDAAVLGLSPRGWWRLHRLWVEMTWLMDELLYFAILLRNSRVIEGYCLFVTAAVAQHPVMRAWSRCKDTLPRGGVYDVFWHFVEALDELPCITPSSLSSSSSST